MNSSEAAHGPKYCEATRTRSWLFTPGTRPERLERAAEVGTDVLIIDLEDSVASEDKPCARSTAVDYLSKKAGGKIARALRINGLDGRPSVDDLCDLLNSSAEPDLLVLPRTESAAHLRILDDLLTGTNKSTRLVALIESAEGLASAYAIAAATPRLVALMFGAAEMAVDLGAETAWEPLLYARSRLVAACARAGVPAIDSPYFDINDGDGLKGEIERSRALGFAGKAAIRPSQVQQINATFAAAKKAEARAILTENIGGVATR